jgi:hypothetical protein
VKKSWPFFLYENGAKPDFAKSNTLVTKSIRTQSPLFIFGSGFLTISLTSFGSWPSYTTSQAINPPPKI